MSLNPWNLLAKKRVLSAKVFDYEQQEFEMPSTGKKGVFDVLLCPDWVNVVAVDTADKIVLVKQFRIGINDFTLETPGGVIDPGEDPLSAAKRELREETGYESNDWEKLGAVKSNPAFINNTCHFYLASKCEKRSFQDFDEFEEIELQLAEKTVVKEMILQGQINHSLVVNALLLFSLKK